VNKKVSTVNRTRGFSLVELVVSVIIALILLVIFLNRSQYYQERAEKAGMESVGVALDGALTLQYSQLMTRGRAEDAVALKNVNPMSWLVTPPKNYSGEFFDPDAGRVEAGNWFFDLKSRELVYVVRNRSHFKPDHAGYFWIHFHVVSRDELSQGTTPAGLKFESVVPYSWF
jgi:prepilin-type N-terminal cleavage/methylation domain-containing protein